MSLFVAVVPPLAAVEDLQDALQRARRHQVAAPVHWHPADRWHITMCFLGEPDESADEHLAEAVDDLACRAVGPTVHLAGAGVFGRQVLWIGAAGVDDAQSDAFADLAAAISKSARASGFTIERRPWRPHLTIGRTRGSDARPVAPLLAGYDGPHWQVAELLTVRSQGGPRPVHTVVHRSVIAATIPPAGDRRA